MQLLLTRTDVLAVCGICTDAPAGASMQLLLTRADDLAVRGICTNALAVCGIRTDGLAV